MGSKENHNLLGGLKWPRFMMVITLIWILIALLLSFKYSIYLLSVGKEVHWNHLFLFNFNSSVLWILLTPLILLITNILFASSWQWYTIVSFHLLVAMVLLPIQGYLFLRLDYETQNILGLWGDHMNFPQYLSNYFGEVLVEGFITYVILVGLLTGYMLYLRNRKVSELKAKLEENLVQSRIQNLKYQLQPHFLFNSMQTISNLIYKDEKLADKAVTNLSDILRFSINQLNNDFTELEKEIDITQKYLNFQKLRFGNKIKYSLQVEDGLSLVLIPALLLQPLVENSIKHGFAKTGRPMKIRIEIKATEKTLVLAVLDDGPGFNMDAKNTILGTGLNNLKNRLGYFYNKDFDLTIKDLHPGASVQITIPKKLRDD